MSSDLGLYCRTCFTYGVVDFFAFCCYSTLAMFDSLPNCISALAALTAAFSQQVFNTQHVSSRVLRTGMSVYLCCDKLL